MKVPQICERLFNLIEEKTKDHNEDQFEVIN